MTIMMGWILTQGSEEVQSKVDLWWGLDTSNIIVIISFVVAIWSWWYTRETVVSIRNEADKDRIDKECQRRLLMDIIRHLYRNKVCTLAMQAKYLRGKMMGYPSDEHFLKLKLLPRDIYLEQFYKDPDKFHLLHELEMLFRNYNTEIDVAQKHLSDKDMDYHTKMRDFGTLSFKPGYLAGRILGVMAQIWSEEGSTMYEKCDDDTRKVQLAKEVEVLKKEKQLSEEECKAMAYYRLEMADMVRTSYRKNVKDNEGNQYDVTDDVLSAAEKNDAFCTNIFCGHEQEFLDMLKLDVNIECGFNKKNEEKIYLIPYVR